MSHLDILIPFGLPPAEISTDLLKQLKLPALATLTARAKSESGTAHIETFNDFSRALPHEIWLVRQFGMDAHLKSDNSPPIATALMQSFGVTPEAGTWFVLQPVHIHIARDHLVLTDLRHLQLTDKDARALFDIARPLFEEVGKDLVFGNASTWFVRADDWSELHTSTPDAAGGHNIDIWMPKGPGERDWRKVQNEVQMYWFDHSINAAREINGLKPVNSIWLWGGAPEKIHSQSRYSQTFNLSGWHTAYGHLAPQRATDANANDVLTAKSEQSLLVLDDLLEPALSNDWSRWLESMHMLEENWFAPLLQALKTGKIARVSLVATNNSHISRFTVTKTSLRKFWVKPTLATLCP